MTGTMQYNDNLTAIFYSTLAFENGLFQNMFFNIKAFVKEEKKIS